MNKPVCKVFSVWEVESAKEHALLGGQALHTHRIVFPDSPRCFRAAVARGEYIAHLFDQDELRLVATAKWAGVRVIVVEHPGTPRQHIDLCGAPLKRLLDHVMAVEEKGLFQ